MRTLVGSRTGPVLASLVLLFAAPPARAGWHFVGELSAGTMPVFADAAWPLAPGASLGIGAEARGTSWFAGPRLRGGGFIEAGNREGFLLGNVNPEFVVGRSWRVDEDTAVVAAGRVGLNVFLVCGSDGFECQMGAGAPVAAEVVVETPMVSSSLLRATFETRFPLFPHVSLPAVSVQLAFIP